MPPIPRNRAIVPYNPPVTEIVHVPSGSRTNKPPTKSSETKPKRRWLRNLGIGAGIAAGLYGTKSAYDYFTDNELDDYRDARLMALLNGEIGDAVNQGGGDLQNLESIVRGTMRFSPMENRTVRVPKASGDLTHLLTEADLQRLANLRQKQMMTREQILAGLGVY